MQALTGRLGVQASNAASNAAIRAVTVCAGLAECVGVMNCEGRHRKNLTLSQDVAKGSLRSILDSPVHLAKQLSSATLASSEEQILKRLGACCGPWRR